MSKNVSDKSRKTKLKSRFQCQTNLIVDFKNESYIFCTQRFAAWRSGGFLAQKFNRRTALESTTKMSYEALHPPLRQTAVVRSVFFFRPVCLSVAGWNRHTLCQVLANVSAGATWQCVWLLSIGL